MNKWVYLLFCVFFMGCTPINNIYVQKFNVINDYEQNISDLIWSEDQKSIYFIYRNAKSLDIGFHNNYFAFKNVAIPRFFIYKLSMESSTTNHLVYSYEPKPPYYETNYYEGQFNIYKLSFIKDIMGEKTNLLLFYQDFDKSDYSSFLMININNESNKITEKSNFSIINSKPYCKFRNQIVTGDYFFDFALSQDISELQLTMSKTVLPPQGLLDCFSKQNLVPYKNTSKENSSKEDVYIAKYDPEKQIFDHSVKVPLPLPSANPNLKRPDLDPEWQVLGWIGDDKLAFRKQNTYKYFNYSKQELHDFQGPQDAFEVFAISPDYKKVAYVTQHKLFVADIHGENKKELLDIFQDLPKGDRVEIDADAIE